MFVVALLFGQWELFQAHVHVVREPTQAKVQDKLYMFGLPTMTV